MSERITSLQASDVARIATTMPLQPTSADLLRALHQAWKCGYSGGRVHGIIEGQRHVAEVQDLVFKAMTP